MFKRLLPSVLGVATLCTQPLWAEAPAPTQSGAVSPNAVERPVSLDEVLRHAAQHAPAIRLARAEAARGRARLVAASPLFPSEPVLSGSFGRRYTPGGSGFDFSFALEQEVDLGGKRSAAIDAARAGQRAMEASVLAAEWAVHQRVHEAFHQSLIARESARAAARSARFAERVVQVASQRFAAGETSELPVRLAKAELAQATQAALLARSDYDRRRLALAEVAGFTGTELLTPSEPLESPTAPPPLESLLRLARTKQPALASARARVEAARAELQATEPLGWPNPTLGLGYESEANPGASPDRIVRGTLSIPLPFWVGNAPARATAQAELESASAEREGLATVLEVRIREAHERVRASAERAKVFEAEVLPTFETNLTLLDKAFELGEIDVLEVMVAQERFLRTEQEALRTFADYYAAWAALEAVVGAELSPALTPAPAGRPR